MVFTPREPLMFGDAAQTVVDTVAGAFVIGVQMSAPFIVFSLVFNLGMGILSRLMPQLQVFFIAMPATVGVGLILHGAAAHHDDGALPHPLSRACSRRSGGV